MSLKDKLENLNKLSQKNGTDWEQKKINWQKEIISIYDKIKIWLKSYIDVESPLISPIEVEKSITEENIGSYNTTQLELEFGNFSLIFEPVGCDILGANGRIDVYFRGYKSDKYILVLLQNEDNTNKWFIAPFKDRMQRIEFNKENLEKLIEDWINQNVI